MACPSTVAASCEGVAAPDAPGGDMGWSGDCVRCDCVVVRECWASDAD